MTNRNLVLIVCLICASCTRQTDKSLISNWKSYSSPPKETDTNSHKEWTVLLKNDTIRAVNTAKNNPPLFPFADTLKARYGSKGMFSFLKVDDGYLVGMYRGEWGGNLYWFSEDGKKNYKISDDEVIQFIQKDRKTYAIQGLMHLSISEGSIIAIVKENNRWIGKPYVQLPAAPGAIELANNHDFIVMTSAGLFKVDENLNVTKLADKVGGNSMVLKDNVVYTGRHGGVYKYNMLTGKREWLEPN
jgi:hypothetical protein